MLTMLTVLAAWLVSGAACGADHIYELQSQAIADGRADFGHWGVNPDNYTQWGSHSNRLIPVYTFGTRGGGDGIDLDSYFGERSPYRDPAALQRIYGFVPVDTVSPAAVSMDQTNLYDLQLAALGAGRKHVILIVFDGMDWQTTRAAAIYNARSVSYAEGRGTGTHFQEYDAGGTSQFGWMVTSPHNEGTQVDVNSQQITSLAGIQLGGYNAARAGEFPWSTAPDLDYLVGQPKSDPGVHAYTDSSSSASSMSAGIKTYNNAVNVDAAGTPVPTIAHLAQDRGYSVGVVTSVPISHATPACMYAHNVFRDDYQDITRDLVGLPSIMHPTEPLPGMDVVIGCGFGTTSDADAAQGTNFVPGNRYLTDADLHAINADCGGRYVVAQRTAGVRGADGLSAGAARAIRERRRLFGFYGVGSHLPWQTADGDYRPAPGRSSVESYTDADLFENPTLADMTRSALAVLSCNPQGFWLMVEAGDVDWANHQNNLDTSIGAVNSGDEAVRAVTDWVEQHSNWNETVVIVTADHGHYLVLDRPELLIPPP